MRIKILLTVLFCLLFCGVVIAEDATVTRVIDGDTIESGKRKIRLIGVNTPEIRPKQAYGQEAKAFVLTIIQNNKNKVRLEVDGQQVDRYGRELRHVYVGETLVSEQLLLKGLAKKQLQYRYSKVMKERFTVAEKQAQTKKIGIWKSL
jgi:micrococcal nuclease